MQRLGEFKGQERIPIQHGRSRWWICMLDELLFAALARAAEWRLGKFNAQELANTGWAQTV